MYTKMKFTYKVSYSKKTQQVSVLSKVYIWNQNTNALLIIVAISSPVLVMKGSYAVVIWKECSQRSNSDENAESQHSKKLSIMFTMNNRINQAQ